MKLLVRPIILISVLTLSGWGSVALAELYRYENEDGVIVLDSHVPARFVKKGYSILSMDGRVLEVVPRALTEEEIRERDKRLAEEERKEREERERRERDEMLMRLYATPGDVIRARDSKLDSIEAMIDTQRGNIERLESQQRSLEASLADIERAGGVIDQQRLVRINTLEKRIEQIETEIAKKQTEKQDLEISFSEDLKRVKELYHR